MRKSGLIACLCMLLWMMGMGSTAAEAHEMSMVTAVKSNLKLMLNGKPLQVEESYLIDNALFVPYRAFAEGIGAKVNYETATRTVSVKKDAKIVRFQLGSSEAMVDGSSQMMVGPAQIIHNATFVHARFLAEVFGIQVQYDKAAHTVNLVSKQSSENPEAKTYYVTIEGFQFKGGNITVEAGSTIVFTNKDKVKHNAVAVDGSFKLPLLATGESGSITLKEPGEYDYFCELHKNAMQATITVK
ncbi:stalk domain-containing protein [Paenibacillus sp. CF384]|uniref:stalk domain-containing protein n=1 Tax=Paenibacillus sp. CF384 TaxID=1884382 RepID=UPI00089A2CD2|nr:stalk domain-containing protein [Paenibacillus sp. CF384]SDX99662.1 Plastocyanin [Paenibacillus sp. CF384]